MARNVDKYTNYRVTNRFVPVKKQVVDDNGIVTWEPDFKRGIDISNEFMEDDGSQVDNRLYLFTTYSDNSLLDYLNYYDYLSAVINSNKDKDNVNIFYNNLMLGYIPVIIPPTHMCKEMRELLLPIIQKHEIRFFESTARRPDGTTIQNVEKDVWCSRLDIARLLNCRPEHVEVGKFLSLR